MPRQHLTPTEQKYLREMKTRDAWVSICRPLIFMAGLVLIVYFLSDMLKEYAGKISYNEIIANFTAKIGADKYVAYILTALFGGWGTYERLQSNKLRKKLDDEEELSKNKPKRRKKT